MKVKNIQIIFMEVRELRIGNWVSHWGDSCMVKEIKHENTSFYLYCADTLNDLVNVGNVIDAFKPIPLTPEILEKAGFEKKDMGIVWQYGKRGRNFWFLILHDPKFEHFCFDSPHHTHFFKYVHQLQNLIFALTGEELAIELNKEKV